MSVNVPSGYKQTKVGILPEDWDVVKLGDVLEEKPKYGINAPAVDYSPQLPTYLRITDIDDSGSFNPKKIVSVDHLDYKKFILQENELVFARTGATVGKSYLYDMNDGELIYAGFLIKIKPNTKILNSVFLKNFTNTHFYWHWIQVMSARSGQPGVNGEEYATMPIPLPPLKEQQKIAQILTTWDEVISKQEALIKAKEQLKKGLMQKLLSGEVRFDGFDGEWEEVLLSEVLFHNARPVDKPQKGYWKLGLRSHAKGTFHTFVEDPETVSMDTLYIVKENDLIVNITFAWEHALALASIEDEGKLVSHRFPTYVFKSGYSPLFFKYFMIQPRFKYELENISPGGAGRNRVMSKKDFVKLKVTVPSLEEQEKIVKVLIQVDKEIDLLKNEFEALKEQKRGLMQKLLSGEVRIMNRRGK